MQIIKTGKVNCVLGIELVGVATEAGITSGGDFVATSASNASPGDVPLYRLRPGGQRQ